MRRRVKMKGIERCTKTNQRNENLRLASRMYPKGRLEKKAKHSKLVICKA